MPKSTLPRPFCLAARQAWSSPESSKTVLLPKAKRGLVRAASRVVLALVALATPLTAENAGEPPGAGTADLQLAAQDSGVALRIEGLFPVMTGWHRIEALVADSNVDRVDWLVNGKPVRAGDRRSAELYFGRTPQPRTIEALAYDRDGELEYRARTTVNAGGRAHLVEFLRPLSGARLSGPTDVELCVSAPPDREIARVEIEVGDVRSGSSISVAMQPAGALRCRQGIAYLTRVDLASGPTVLTARSYAIRRQLQEGESERQPTHERSLVVNMPPSLDDEVDVRVLEWPVQVLRRRAPVPGLDASRFELWQDGETRAIERVVEAHEVPFRLGLLFDWSGSTALDGDVEARAATDFVASLFDPGKDTVRISAIAHVPVPYLDWTGDGEQIASALGRIQSGYKMPGGTALYDSIVDALYHFQNDPVRGAPALVLLSDGVDTASSDFTRDQALAYARESGVPIYPIGVLVRLDKKRHTELEREFLTELATESGGTYFEIAVDRSATELQRQAAQHRRQAEELRSQPGELEQDPRFLAYLIAQEEQAAVSLESRAARLGRKNASPLASLRSAFDHIRTDLSSSYLIVSQDLGPRRDQWHSIEVRLKEARGSELEVRAPRGLYW